MKECKKLNTILSNKDLSIKELNNWLNNNCDCNICSNYNFILKFIEEDFFIDKNKKEFVNNNHFKKINLTDKMKETINNEIYNKIMFNKLFKLIN